MIFVLILMKSPYKDLKITYWVLPQISLQMRDVQRGWILRWRFWTGLTCSWNFVFILDHKIVWNSPYIVLSLVIYINESETYPWWMWVVTSHILRKILYCATVPALKLLRGTSISDWNWNVNFTYFMWWNIFGY